jgi:hypothetical protein
MMIKDLGAGVVSVWEGLRPMTKTMLVGALRSNSPSPANNPQQNFSYDAHADWELSRLLTALDEQSRDPSTERGARSLDQISQLAETCVMVLEDQCGTAEIYIQLAERALKRNDFVKLDALSEKLLSQFSSAEIAEIVRQSETPQIRAIAFESLSILSVPSIEPLLDDPLYTDIALNVLEQKAYEYDSDEARDVLDMLYQDNTVRSE